MRDPGIEVPLRRGSHSIQTESFKKMSKISAYILAYNEASKIGEAVKSVLWADEIVVADSHSKDSTAEIASAMGARVVQIPFTGFGELRNKAIAECSHDWILSLDADERCTPEVKEEILRIIESEDPLEAYYIPRKNVFMGRWIKHSGYYPDYRQPQLFRRGAIVFRPDPVHERFDLHTSRPPGYLSHAIWQVPFLNFEELLRKANRYSSLGALKLEKEGRSSSMLTAALHAIWAFIHIYLLKQGFLDGWAGFVIAFGNFEGTFYKYAKLHESLTRRSTDKPYQI
jgi:glycosyltransferase involved in cell wall biosynthesis